MLNAAWQQYDRSRGGPAPAGAPAAVPAVPAVGGPRPAATPAQVARAHARYLEATQPALDQAAAHAAAQADAHAAAVARADAAQREIEAATQHLFEPGAGAPAPAGPLVLPFDFGDPGGPPPTPEEVAALTAAWQQYDESRGGAYGGRQQGSAPVAGLPESGPDYAALMPRPAPRTPGNRVVDTRPRPAQPPEPPTPEPSYAVPPESAARLAAERARQRAAVEAEDARRAAAGLPTLAEEQAQRDDLRDLQTGFPVGSTRVTRAGGGDASSVPADERGGLPSGDLLTTRPLEEQVDRQGGRIDVGMADPAAYARAFADAWRFVEAASGRAVGHPDAPPLEIPDDVLPERRGAYLAAAGALDQAAGAPAQALNALLKAAAGTDLLGREQSLLDRLRAVPELAGAVVSLVGAVTAPATGGASLLPAYRPEALTNYLIGAGVKPEYALLAGALVDIASPDDVRLARGGVFSPRPASRAERAVEAAGGTLYGGLALGEELGADRSGDTQPVGQVFAGTLARVLDEADGGRVAGGMASGAARLAGQAARLAGAESVASSGLLSSAGEQPTGALPGGGRETRLEAEPTVGGDSGLPVPPHSAADGSAQEAAVGLGDAAAVDRPKGPGPILVVRPRHPSDAGIPVTDEIRRVLDLSHPGSPVSNGIAVARRIQVAPRVRFRGGLEVPVADIGDLIPLGLNYALSKAPYLPRVAELDQEAVKLIASSVLPMKGYQVRPDLPLFVLTYHGAPGIHVESTAVGFNPWIHDQCVQRMVELGWVLPDNRAITTSIEDTKTKIHELLHEADPSLTEDEVNGIVEELMIDSGVRKALAPYMAERAAHYEALFTMDQWRRDEVVLRTAYNRRTLDMLRRMRSLRGTQLPNDPTSFLWDRGLHHERALGRP